MADSFEDYRDTVRQVAAAREETIARLIREREALRKALQRSEYEFETIRQILVGNLTEPERTAFWRAVNARDATRAALASLEPKKD